MIRRRTILQSGLMGLASAGLPWPVAARTKFDDRLLAALLVPLTGPGTDVGRSLHHAADLAQPASADVKTPIVAFDTGTTPNGARAAAAAAVARGAAVIIGPLYGPQIAGVVAAGGGIPVVALASDDSAAAGAFVLGITPRQSTAAILGYARSRGVRRVAVDAGTTAWDQAAAAAAVLATRDLGLSLVGTDDATPDAVFIPGDADAFVAVARRMSGSGVQLLGTHQALTLSGAGLAAIDGAWLAAPDPDGFGDFARRFEAAFGNAPGLVAGLVYDAVRIAATLRANGHLDRDGLTGSAGFPGVTGAVRFHADGRATRELAILVANGAGFRTAAHSEG